MTSQRRLGIIQVLCAGACFGLLGYFGKMAFQAGISPTELLSLRFLTSAILLAVYSFFTPIKLWQVRPKVLIASLLLGALGYAVFSSFYFLALQGLSASLTVLLLYTYPILVAVGAEIFFNEHLGKRGLLALALSMIGLVGLVWGEWQVSQPLYLMFGFGSALFYAIYILISNKVLANVPPTLSTFYILLGAGLVLCVLSFQDWERPRYLLNQHIGMIFAMAFVCSLLAMTLFQAGLQKLSSAETSIVSTSEPLFSILAAVLLLGEEMGMIQMVGGVLVLAAMLLLSTRKINP